MVIRAQRSPRPRLLVTGSHGVLGSRLVPALEAQGYEVVPLDLKAPAPADLLDRAELHHRLVGCVGILHLAAVARVPDAEANPTHCQLVNVEGTRGLLSQALEAPLRPWLIFISSREVYGACPPTPIDESHPLSPVNVYGHSKLEGERRVLAASRAGLQCAILRLTNLYGSPHDYPERVILRFTRQALLGEPLHLVGPEKQIDFLHLEDALCGILCVVKRLQEGWRPGGPLHLASGTAWSLEQLAQKILSLTASQSPLTTDPVAPTVANGFVGDPSAARQLLDWQARIPLEEGLARLALDVHPIVSPKLEV